MLKKRHPGLVVDAASRMPVGYGHIKVWSRDRSENRQKKQRRGKVKLEAKESYRWVETAEKTVASLPSGVRVTMVGDRENDVYSVMCKTLACGCDFLVRSVHDRPVDCDVDGGSMGIKAYMQSLPVALTYNLELQGHKGRNARTAKMLLRFARVTIHKNGNCLDDVQESLTCYCVYAVEDASSCSGEAWNWPWPRKYSKTIDTSARRIREQVTRKSRKSQKGLVRGTRSTAGAWTASPPARASISTEDVRLRSAIIPSRSFLCFFIVFLRLCRRKLVPLQRFLEKALRERAAPRHRASSLHSVCTVLARCNQEHH